MIRIPFPILILALALSAADLRAQTPYRQRTAERGIAIELQVDHADPGKTSGDFREGDTLIVRFNLSDQTSGLPMTNLLPAGWLSLEHGGRPASPELCVKKAQTYLGGSLLGKPEASLNAYFVLCLNRDNTMTVIDPVFGFGGSRLLHLVQFESPAEDWVLSANQKYVYLSLPDSRKIVRVSTESWSIDASYALPGRPQALALDDGADTLWVGCSDSPDSGVVAISCREGKVLATVPTGAGTHCLRFDRDHHRLYVTNRDVGTLSVIDTAQRRKLADLAVGQKPVSLAYSAFAQTLLVADQASGELTAVSAADQRVLARMATEPGLTQVVFAPDGRYAFAINPDKDQLTIVDAAANRIVQQCTVGSKPSQVCFTERLAYILHQDSETVLMVPLTEIGLDGKPVPLVDFPGGRLPLEQAGRTIVTALAPTPADPAVIFPDPDNQSIYYYAEGMAAPMGSFKNYGHTPRGIAILDRSLQERHQPGLYETVVKVDAPGVYDVVFFLQTPQIATCFPLAIQPDPTKERARHQQVKRVVFAPDQQVVTVAQPHQIRFHIGDYANQGFTGLADVEVLVSSPDNWHKRFKAQELGNGVYAADFVPPRPGSYKVFVASRSLDLSFEKNPPLALSARASATAPVQMPAPGGAQP